MASTTNSAATTNQTQINQDANPPSSHPASSVEKDKSDPDQLEDLETSLLALEKLDRASPDLWPHHFPGVSQFVPLDTPTDSPANQNNILQGLTQDDLATIHQLGNLAPSTLLQEVQRLLNIAYQLGLEETKEMTRGKYLNILRKNRH